ncbi:MAG: S-adenosylmethionine:tRNA ribosyltransferase-isomerase [Acidimicrobiales bacterium]
MTRPPRISMDDFSYELPDHAVAQRPVEPRSAARLLVAPEVAGTRMPLHATVDDLPLLLRPGDVLVVNDTRVLAARLHLFRSSGGRAELLLLERDIADDGVLPGTPSRPERWAAMVRPGRRLRPGSLLFETPEGPPVAEVGPPLGGGEDGRRSVCLLDPSVIERSGRVPLPPYIHTPLSDPDRYQTVYAGRRGIGDRSVAAPTAGLHFTEGLLDRCSRAGATVVRCDLTIGADTFRPVSARWAEDHRMHSERYAVPAETMAAVGRAQRVVAIGTTAVRALETAALTGELSGRTRLFIHGRYRFRLVDLLLTNFHLPRSSLLLLVEAFYGPQWRALYAEALTEGYRFLSFGDAMIVARKDRSAVASSAFP